MYVNYTHTHIMHATLFTGSFTAKPYTGFCLPMDTVKLMVYRALN